MHKMIVQLSYTDLRSIVHMYKKREKKGHKSKQIQLKSGGFEKKIQKQNYFPIVFNFH